MGGGVRGIPVAQEGSWYSPSSARGNTTTPAPLSPPGLAGPFRLCSKVAPKSSECQNEKVFSHVSKTLTLFHHGSRPISRTHKDLLLTASNLQASPPKKNLTSDATPGRQPRVSWRSDFMDVWAFSERKRPFSLGANLP